MAMLLTSCESMGSLGESFDRFLRDTLNIPEYGSERARQSESTPIESPDASRENGDQAHPVAADSDEKRAADFSLSDNPENRADNLRFRNGVPDPRAVDALGRYSPLFQSDMDEGIEGLAEYLRTADDDPMVQARLLHDVLALHLSYDYRGFRSGNVPTQNPISVLRRGTAVCQGYADSFSYIGRKMGLNVITVSGYARGIGSGSFAREDPSESNHAWNVLTVKGSRYIIDVTWDSDDYSTDYLFLYPEQAIYSRLPSRPGYQFLAEKISTSEFTNLPFIRGAYFDIYSTVPSNLGRVMQLRDYSSFALPGVSDYGFSAHWVDSAGVRSRNGIFIEADSEETRVYLAPESEGEQTLQIFAKSGTTPESRFIMELGIIAARVEHILLPELYSGYYEGSARLLSDPAMDMRSDERKTLRIHIPGAEDAFVSLQGSRRITMSRSDNHVFSADIPCAPGIQIFAKLESASRYTGIIGY
ncbi:transglutaminase domain-containing protein [Salinispira pacifica]|uniref:transglutaminase domain-containing protein n=1 Tax=Salinispira pacifica TaxID=1307761 RepID=UPI0009DCFB99|nr:transglutaminase domain-containing protein [Salinispira pacifica]